MNRLSESSGTAQSLVGLKRDIHDLPVEILGRILGDHLNPTPDDPDIYPGRLAPLEVCHLWKDTALSNPSCWRRLEIVISMQRSTSATICRRMKDQFMRAQTLSVDLHLRGGNLSFLEGEEQHIGDFFVGTWRDPTVEDEEDYEEAITDFLTKYSGRIRSYSEHEMYLDFQALRALSINPSKSLTHLAIPRLFSEDHKGYQYHFPALKSLYISRLQRGLPKLSCPSLESLTLDGGRPFRFAGSPDIVSAPFVHLMLMLTCLRKLVIPL